MNSPLNWTGARSVALGMVLALAFSSSYCAREKADEHAENAEAHEHGSEEHGHEHDPKSLGKVTMMPDALAANQVVIKRSGPGLVTTEIDLPGEIVLNADRVAHVVPRFPGIVQKVNKSLGESVRAGDVLAVVQSNVSAAPYDVVAMVDGTVIEKHVALGEFVRDDSDIFVVADLSTVWVNISVYARFLTDVKLGQKVRLTSPGVGETALGTIDYVGPVVGESTRTGVARMVLRNPKKIWQPGLFVTAHIIVSEQQAPIAVPDAAVQTVEGRNVVFVRSMNEFTARPVVIGRRGGELIEILQGLEAGEDYVAQGSFIFKAEFGKSEAGHEH
jgi:membrane fusion protein, heavy metal efflux system